MPLQQAHRFPPNSCLLFPSGSPNWSDASGTENMEITFVDERASIVDRLDSMFDELFDQAEEAIP